MPTTQDGPLDGIVLYIPRQMRAEIEEIAEATGQSFNRAGWSLLAHAIYLHHDTQKRINGSADARPANERASTEQPRLSTRLTEGDCRLTEIYCTGCNASTPMGGPDVTHNDGCPLSNAPSSNTTSRQPLLQRRAAN